MVTAAVALGPRRAQRRHAGPGVTRAELPRALRALWRGWGLAPAEVAGLAVAARGVWTSAERRALARALAPLARRVRALADVEAAHLGALGGAPGVLLLAGTGSIALGRDRRGRWGRAGGLGPLVGDEGSAFWIGAAWLRARAAAGELARARQLGSRPDAVARIAALAPAVLARARGGDRACRQLVARAQGHLADAVARVAARLGARRSAPLALSWAGGLLEDARFRTGVWRALRAAGWRPAPRAPLRPAVEAAAEMARALATGRRPASGARVRPSGALTGPAAWALSRRARAAA